MSTTPRHLLAIAAAAGLLLSCSSNDNPAASPANTTAAGAITVTDSDAAPADDPAANSATDPSAGDDTGPRTSEPVSSPAADTSPAAPVSDGQELPQAGETSVGLPEDFPNVVPLPEKHTIISSGESAGPRSWILTITVDDPAATFDAMTTAFSDKGWTVLEDSDPNVAYFDNATYGAALTLDADTLSYVIEEL